MQIAYGLCDNYEKIQNALHGALRFIGDYGVLLTKIRKKVTYRSVSRSF